MRRWIFLGLVLVCVVLALRIGERFAWQLDVSEGRIHSLTPAAVAALDALSGPLEITVYLPELTVQRAQVDRLLEPYRSHRPDTRVAFVDPVSEPQRAREAGVSRRGELHLRTGQRREVVEQPERRQIDAALVRLARQGDRWIVSLQGHGESTLKSGPGGLARFVARVEALGYRVITLDPRQVERLPENTALLLAAAPTQVYGEHTRRLIAAYVADGGSLLWFADTSPPTLPDETIPIGLLPGYVVDASAARYGLNNPDNAIITDFPEVLSLRAQGPAVIKRARGLHHDDPGPDEMRRWQRLGSLHSGAQSWNETGAVQGQIARDPGSGERAGPITVGLLMQGVGSEPSGRIAVIGGRPFVDNEQVGRRDNLQLGLALVNWLTGNQQLAPNRPVTDLDIRWSPLLGGTLAIALMALLPAAYLFVGLWLRARRRRT